MSEKKYLVGADKNVCYGSFFEEPKRLDDYVEKIRGSEDEKGKRYAFLRFKHPIYTDKKQFDSFIAERTKLNEALTSINDSARGDFFVETCEGFIARVQYKPFQNEIDKVRPYYYFERYEMDEGVNLNTVRSGVEESEKLNFLLSLAEAVRSLHNHGIVHAGISPYAVGVYKGKAYLGGFYPSFLKKDLSSTWGKEVDPLVTHGVNHIPLHRMGISFSSPEMGAHYLDKKREVSTKTDIFSLGLYIHWYLTGNLPMDSSIIHWMDGSEKIGDRFPWKVSTSNRSLQISFDIKDKNLRELLQKMLEYSPTNRCDASDVCEKLRTIMATKDSDTMKTKKSIKYLMGKSFDISPLDGYAWDKEKMINVCKYNSWEFDRKKQNWVCFFMEGKKDFARTLPVEKLRQLNWIVPVKNKDAESKAVEEVKETQLAEEVEEVQPVEKTTEREPIKVVEESTEPAKTEPSMEELEEQKEKQEKAQKTFKEEAIDCARKYYLLIKKAFGDPLDKRLNEESQYEYIAEELLPKLKGGSGNVDISEILSGVFELLEKAGEISLESLPALELAEEDFQDDEQDYEKPYPLAGFEGAATKVDEEFTALENAVAKSGEKVDKEQILAEIVDINADFKDEGQPWFESRFDELIEKEEVTAVFDINAIDKEEWLRTTQRYKDCAVEIARLTNEINEKIKRDTSI